MKLISSRYLLLNLDANKTEWSYQIPPGLIKLNDPQMERLKIYVKKAVYRSDFPVITVNRDFILVNYQPVYVRHGSPDALLFAAELTRKCQEGNWQLSFTFDPYDAKLYISNTSPIHTYRVEGGVLSTVTGITDVINIGPGETIAAQSQIDLAPPEVIVLKMINLVSNNLELQSNGDAKSSDILVIIGNDVPPYQTGVYRDNGGEYGHFLLRPELTNIQLRLENNEGIPISTPNPITIVLAVEIWIDEEKELLKVNREMLDINKLQLIGSDGSWAKP